MQRINPKRIMLTRTSQSVNHNSTPKKPNIQNIQDLYTIWNNSPIVYFPAGAMTASIKKRTQALEKFVKNNGLEVDVKNLELFFDDVKKNMSGGAIGSNQYLLKRFNDYIENGYAPNLITEKTVLTRNQSSIIDDYLKNLNKPTVNISYSDDTKNNEINTELDSIQTELESLKKIIEDSLKNSFNLFNDSSNIENKFSDIKSKIESLQYQIDSTNDESLKVKLQRLKTDLEALKAELDALKQALDDNINKTFNIFNDGTKKNEKLEPTDENWQDMKRIYTRTLAGGNLFPEEVRRNELEKYIDKHNLNITLDNAITNIQQMIKDEIGSINVSFTDFDITETDDLKNNKNNEFDKIQAEIDALKKTLKDDISSTFNIFNDDSKIEPTDANWQDMFKIYTQRSRGGGLKLAEEQCIKRLELYIKDNNLNVSLEDAIAKIQQMINVEIGEIEQNFNFFK